MWQALVLGSISARVFWLFFFVGATRSPEGAKQRAVKKSEKVRQLWTRSVCKSQVLRSNSARRVSLGFAGAVRAAVGIGEALEVSRGGSEERRAGDSSQVQ